MNLGEAKWRSFGRVARISPPCSHPPYEIRVGVLQQTIPTTGESKAGGICWVDEVDDEFLFPPAGYPLCPQSQSGRLEPGQPSVLIPSATLLPPRCVRPNRLLPTTSTFQQLDKENQDNGYITAFEHPRGPALHHPPHLFPHQEKPLEQVPLTYSPTYLLTHSPCPRKKKKRESWKGREFSV